MGPLIVFEGIDGTGKGSQVKRAVGYLSDKLGSSRVVQSKDPGGTKLGMAIRRVMYEEVPTTEMAPGVVDLMFLASHLQNWKTVVEPALNQDKVVVLDRWWYSQEVYSKERFVPYHIGAAYELCHGPRADLLIFLHARDVKQVVDRARARQEETHQSAKAWNDYGKLESIQRHYVRNFQFHSGWRSVEVTDRTIDAVWDEVRWLVDDFMGKRSAGVAHA